VARLLDKQLAVMLFYRDMPLMVDRGMLDIIMLKISDGW
jgi:hypothetical protein